MFAVSLVTIKPQNPLLKQKLKDYGQYLVECLPHYIQQVDVSFGNELEVMIHPDGVVPVLTFLRDHMNAQFSVITDIAGMDVPMRQYRFEVSLQCGVCSNLTLITCWDDNYWPWCFHYFATAGNI